MTMRHMVGYELSGSEAALAAITPIPDGTVQIQNNDIFVPSDITNLGLASVVISSIAATIRGQVQSPSLRAMLNLDVSPLASGPTYGSFPPGMRMYRNPLPLRAGEPLDVFVQNGAAVMNRAFLELIDGPIQPVTGPAFTVRATGSASLATATWQNTTLTFSQTLPSGTFQVVGFRAWSANGVAARIFFKGQTYRPGVLMANAEANNDWPEYRFGGLGVWGQFNNLVPPSVDVMGITDTAQVFFLDLIKVA